MRRFTLRTGLTIVALTTASGAWAADTNDKAFITNAIQGNLAEISVGQLAAQKGTTDAVKNFGQTLVKDHTKANQDAMNVAKTLGMMPPMEPTAEQKSMHDQLASETGATFDKDFATGMVKDHEKDVADYQQEAAASDKGPAAQYASNTLPVLQGHLTTARMLVSQTANESTAGNATSTAGTGLVSGANSFTEGEAKSRIEKAGFSNVGALKKDAQGIWRGTADKNGQSTSVGLDYKGNISPM